MTTNAVHAWMTELHSQIGSLLQAEQSEDAGMLAGLLSLVARGRIEPALTLTVLLLADSDLHGVSRILLVRGCPLLQG